MRVAAPSPPALLMFALAWPLAAAAEPAWSASSSGGSVELLAIWGSGKSDVYAVSREGAVLHSTDGGKAWTARTLPGMAAAGGLTAIYGRDADTVYATGGAQVFRSSDHGASWSAVFTGNADDKLTGVFAAGAGEVVAVGAHGTIVRSADSGVSWERASSNSTSDLAAVWGSSEKDVYAVGAGGALLHSDDGGASWTAQSSPAGEEDLTAVWGSGKDNVFSVGSSGSVLHTHDGGASWQSLWKWDRQLTAIRGASKNDVYAIATTGGALLHATDGKHFAQEKLGVDSALHGVWAASASDVFIVGENGVVLHTAPKGSKGFEQRAGIKGAGRELLTAVWGSGPDDLYVVGYLDSASGSRSGRAGEIFHSTDGGASWQQALQAGPVALHGVWGSGQYNVFVVGDGSTILRSKDGGKGWEAQKSPVKATLRAVWGPSPEEVFAVGDKGRILHTRDGGKNWAAEKSLAGVDLRAVWGADKDALWVAGIDEDKRELVVAGSSDGGKSWKEAFRGSTAVPGGAAGLWGSGKADLWAFGEGEGSDLHLVHSTDEGKTWAPVSAGKGVLRGLWGSSPTELYLCTAGGEILRSSDGGKGFADTHSGTVEALHAVWGSHADNVFVVGEKGLILRRRP